MEYRSEAGLHRFLTERDIRYVVLIGKPERRQVPYSLEMPGAALPADLGDAHRDACLEILALHER